MRWQQPPETAARTPRTRRESPDWHLTVCLVELLFLSALAAAERWICRGAVADTWFGRSPLRYAGLVASAAVGGYWAAAATALRADPRFVLQRASLALAAPMAVLVPYALWDGPAWLLPAAAAAAYFHLRECRGYLKSLRSEAHPASPPAGAVADDLRWLGRNLGLQSMRLLVAENRTADAGKALAEYRPTKPAPTVVFTPAMLEVLDGRELRAVAAHELAHHRLGHSAKTLAAIFARRLVGTGVVCVVLAAWGHGGSGWWAVGAAPAVLLTWYVTQVLLYPLHCAYLRRQERQAWRMALEMTGDEDAFVSALRKIAARNRCAPGGEKWLTWLMGESLTPDEALSLAERIE